MKIFPCSLAAWGCLALLWAASAHAAPPCELQAASGEAVLEAGWNGEGVFEIAMPAGSPLDISATLVPLGGVAFLRGRVGIYPALSVNGKVAFHLPQLDTAETLTLEWQDGARLQTCRLAVRLIEPPQLLSWHNLLWNGSDWESGTELKAERGGLSAGSPEVLLSAPGRPPASVTVGGAAAVIKPTDEGWSARLNLQAGVNQVRVQRRGPIQEAAIDCQPRLCFFKAEGLSVAGVGRPLPEAAPNHFVSPDNSVRLSGNCSFISRGEVTLARNGVTRRLMLADGSFSLPMTDLPPRGETDFRVETTLANRSYADEQWVRWNNTDELKVVLTWDQPGDLDLHVKQPAPLPEIFYHHPGPDAAGGGFLDIDNMEGFGLVSTGEGQHFNQPEQFTLATRLGHHPVPGRYVISVVYFSRKGTATSTRARVQVFKSGRQISDTTKTLEAPSALDTLLTDLFSRPGTEFCTVTLP